MKRQINWNEYLSAAPAGNYIRDNTSYEEQLKKAADLIKNADSILIGAGAGLSAAGGLVYSGSRFKENFSDFIKKYSLEDMYSSTFYPYPTEEAKWAYWARHVMVNRIMPGALDVYKKLRQIAGEEYFVLTTNVDHQFWKAGFKDERIFATQGDYGLIQCARGCHNETYDDTKLFQQMDQAMKDCLVPRYMVPRCPVCGGPMEVNLRKDEFFVEDEHWHKSCEKYASYLSSAKERKVVLLELGVGFNTPMIIRFPFEQLVKKNKEWSLIRLNLGQAFIPENLKERCVGIDGDISSSLNELCRLLFSEDVKTA